MSSLSNRTMLKLHGVSAGRLIEILDSADRYRAQFRDNPTAIGNCHSGHVVANCFFEDSTRTRLSFSLAAKRLGADTIDLTAAGSSVSKGETLVDSALTIEAMGISAMVVRAKPSGAAALIAQHVQCPIINAGDGRHEHPTQGLLDALTLRDCLGDFAGRRVGIVGDINASRVARSNLHALTALSADITLIGPASMIDPTFVNIVVGPGCVEIVHDFDSVLESLDAVMMLRVQRERGSTIGSDYRDRYRLTSDRAARLPAHAVVMHPGPMNRDIEIDCAVADVARTQGGRSVLLEQVANGVFVRMAVLDAALSAELIPS